MLTSGTVVAGYRIERVLGTGGMGAVYVVANPELPRRDALKVLNAELSHNDEFRTRFVREADVASMLDHPNIVSIYRRGTTPDGLLWIAMQFVDGTDADAALKAGAMTPQRAVHITTEVAKALDFAHAHSVVHRDVKPANFLLSGPVGPDERVLLGDFGIARAYDDAGLTATGSLVATIAYAAPEVLSGGAVDGRADLYSLGCTLFRLITGKTPFATTNGMPAVMMAHLQAPPPRVTDHAPGLPSALDAVIAKAMAKEPAHRFGSARELAEAAARSLNDRTMSARTSPWQPIPAAAVTSYPQMSGDVPWWQQGGPHTQAGYAASPTQHGPPQYSLPYTSAPPRRRRTGRLVLAAVAATVALVGAAVGVVEISRHHSDAHGSAAPSTAQSTTSVAAAPLTPKVLDGLLLPPEQVAQVMGASQLSIFKSVDSLIDETSVIDPKSCIGAFAPAENSVYADTGWTAARVQAVHEPGPVPIAFEILQSVIELPTAAAAQKLFNDQSAQWSGCANTDFTASYPNLAPAHWKFGDVTKTDNSMAIPQRWEGPGMPQTGTCQRVMQVQNNVVVDVWACRLGISNQGMDLAKAIAAKIPQ